MILGRAAEEPVAFSICFHTGGIKQMELLMLGLLIIIGLVMLLLLSGSLLAVKYLDEEMNGSRHGGNFPTTCREVVLSLQTNLVQSDRFKIKEFHSDLKQCFFIM